jgi:N-acetyl-gamma-glutamylphosphate reductase
MGVRVAVAGASGYAGGELLRIIAGHPDLEPGPLAAAASAGAPVTDIHPHLAQLAGHTFEPLDPARLAAADLVFLALPHEESAAAAAAMPPGVPVVDLSASFRLGDPRAWSAYYRSPHAGQWCYGLPELPGARQRIAGARRVAAPGCYATAAILALAPLLAAGLADPGDIVIVAASGTSGAGRSPSAALLATEVIGAVSAYQAGGTHRHTPEIEQALRAVLARGDDPPEPPAGPRPHSSVTRHWAPLAWGGTPLPGDTPDPEGPGTPRGPARLPIPPSLAWPASRQAPSRVLARGSTPPPGGPTPVPHGPKLAYNPVAAPWPGGEPVVSFTPMLAPMPRGILATCTVRLREPDTATGALREAIAAAYDGEPFVRLLPEGRWPTTAATNGSNMVHLQAAADAHAGRAVVVAALDNLGKGAAGQAIQAANLMLGLPETAGLPLQGMAP